MSSSEGESVAREVRTLSDDEVAMKRVRLVVKNPAQGYDDYECRVPSSWTVGELKDLLRREYEGKPEVEEQKVIFAGKILQNEQVLSETIKSPLPRQWSSDEAGEAGDEAEDEDEDRVDAKLHLVVRSVMCTPTTSCSGSATTTPLRQETGGARGPAPADVAPSPSPPPSAGATTTPTPPAPAATTPLAPQQPSQPARQQQQQQRPAFEGGEGGVTPLPSSPFASPPIAPFLSSGPQGPADASALISAAYEAALRALTTSSPLSEGMSPNGGATGDGIRSLGPQMLPPMPYPYYYQWPSPYGSMPMSPLGFWPPPPGFVDPSAMVPGMHPNAAGLFSPHHAYYGGAPAAQAHAQAYRAAQEAINATNATNAAPANTTGRDSQAQGQANQENNQNNQNPNPNPIWNYVNLQLTLKLFVLGVIINQDGSVGRLMLTGFVFLFIYMHQMGMFSANGALVQKFCSWYASTFRRLDRTRGPGPESPDVQPVNPLLRIFIEVQWFFIALVASLLPSLSPESFTIDQVRPHQD